MAIKAEVSFSLKDELFNPAKVQLIAKEIAVVYPTFATQKFVNHVTKKFPELELMERLFWIRDCLREFLPAEYQAAGTIFLKSLPPPCDPTLSDNDFGDFIYGPYGAFVAEYGCTKKDLEFSLRALRAMTTRFSVEFPIRTFINTFPKETMAELYMWTTDGHYHVRRLASEGSRPKLPWAKKIIIDYTDPLPMLDALYADTTRFVTRSVANHMNDISKSDPDLVVKTLKRWQKEEKQTTTEMDFIIHHSLRTLEKQGHQAALKLLGYDSQDTVITNFVVHTPIVSVGEALEFSFDVVSTSTKSQRILVDYHLYFNKASGAQSPKTFKIAKSTIGSGQTLSFTKRQPLRPMTTRTLYPGTHLIEIQINGCRYSKQTFELVD